MAGAEIILCCNKGRGILNVAVFIALESGRAVAFWAEWQLLLAPQHLVVVTRACGGAEDGLGCSAVMELLSRGVLPKSVSSLCAAAQARLAVPGCATRCWRAMAFQGILLMIPDPYWA